MIHAQIGDIVEVSFKMVVKKIDSEWTDGIRLYGETTDRKLSLTGIPSSYCSIIEESNGIKSSISLGGVS